MITILFWLATGVLTLVAGSFALSNRELLTVALWPLPGELNAPFYIVAFAIFVVGVLVGRAWAWMGYRRFRAEHRRRRRELDRLKNDKATAAAPQTLPAVRSRTAA